MKKLFEHQLDTNKVITEETLGKLKNKTYNNGDEIKVGDKVLYAFLTDVSAESIKPIELTPMTREEPPHEILLKLITLNEDQFNLYTFDDRFQDKPTKDRLPVIRLKL